MIDLGHATEAEIARQASKVRLVEGVPDIGRRSLLAYLKAHKDSTETPTTVFIEHASKSYVALVGRVGVAAIYRVRNDLQLKRMRRVPEPVAYGAEGFRRERYQGA